MGQVQGRILALEAQPEGGGPPDQPIIWPPPAVANLSGLWKDDSSGGAVYRVRHDGNAFHWLVDGTPQGSHVNIGVGSVASGVVTVRWVDLQGSPTLGGGDLTLRIESADRLVKIGSTAHYGANAWSRVGDASGSGQSPPPPPPITPPAGPVQAITWSDAPTERHRGANGRRFTYSCPPGGTPASVWGTDIYTDDSRLCTAAVHAGLITLAGGGVVTIEIRPDAGSYEGSSRNGITSTAYGPYRGSFVFAR
jgi:hypothetical protein